MDTSNYMDTDMKTDTDMDTTLPQTPKRTPRTLHSLTMPTHMSPPRRTRARAKSSAGGSLRAQKAQKTPSPKKHGGAFRMRGALEMLKSAAGVRKLVLPDKKNKEGKTEGKTGGKAKKGRRSGRKRSASDADAEMTPLTSSDGVRDALEPMTLARVKTRLEVLRRYHSFSNAGFEVKAHIHETQGGADAMDVDSAPPADLKRLRESTASMSTPTLELEVCKPPEDPFATPPPSAGLGTMEMDTDDMPAEVRSAEREIKSLEKLMYVLGPEEKRKRRWFFEFVAGSRIPVRVALRR